MTGGHHLVIAGTGRAGTTALVQLLAAGGLETDNGRLGYEPGANAGLESWLTDADAPYVVKHPYLTDELGPLIAQGFDPARIDGVIVPLRDLDDAASSRIERFQATGVLRIPGGLWRAGRPSLQRAALAEAVHELLLTASEHGIPLYFVVFPRFVTDAAYAWRSLGPLLPEADEARFSALHRETMRPDLVHRQPRIGRARMAALDAKWYLARLRARLR